MSQLESNQTNISFSELESLRRIIERQKEGKSIFCVKFIPEIELLKKEKFEKSSKEIVPTPEPKITPMLELKKNSTILEKKKETYSNDKCKKCLNVSYGLMLSCKKCSSKFHANCCGGFSSSYICEDCKSKKKK
jgi:hypothetical protein